MWTRPLGLACLLSLVGCSTPSTPAADAGTDAGGSTGGDVGVDAAAMPDSGADAGASSDAGTDAGAGDTGTDAGSDAASGTGDAGSDAGSDAGTSPAADHLLFSEIGTGPAAAEFFEIWNPTSAPISLDGYYVSDNAVYYGIATGAAWNPPTSNPGTDFLVGFPAGTTIAAGGVLVVSLATGPNFEASFARCPDFVPATAAYDCADGRSAAPLRVPANGGLDPTKAGTLLSDSREMLVLFRWDGAAAVVTDVDYVTWGATFDAGQTRVDKTGISGYAADTAAASQVPAAAPAVGQSITRCGGEVGETATGGNGVGGHDETSEHLDTAFGITPTRTPGTRGTCG